MPRIGLKIRGDFWYVIKAAKGSEYANFQLFTIFSDLLSILTGLDDRETSSVRITDA